MLTWKEFERKNMDEAFEIAMRICQGRRKYLESHYPIFTADVAAEANLILHEWFDDYKHEHV